ncbi:hypothetical protein [Rariglobus hedericola]|uniref:Lipoprotein n=1 Tax=Rariglobus hedericola TaxID=2597822 RepID=A0A556QS69_9BACT|nr:hypothetical protein [Rariglobus hedericola]TSJ79487.1 hypothetical protein FPL22_09425 [Rariglobus hedericola]
MKKYTGLVSCAALLVVGLFAGCATPPPPRPVVVYPVTYDVPVGNTQVSASAGPQNLNVSATQQVTATVGKPLYYQIISPVAVTVTVYERKSSDMPRVMVREFQGTAFTSSLTPSVSGLEFVFSAQESNSAGTLKFTLSDRPLAPGVSQ